MKIGILGLGYVGLTSAGCLLKEGHTVAGIEPNDAKLAELAGGGCPISEAGLAELLQDGLKAGRLEVFVDPASARLAGCDLVMVCVGTPSAPDGSHDMSHIAAATRDVAGAVRHGGRSEPLTVVYRSTMRPGSIETFVRPVFAEALGDDIESAVELVYNPEFMRESTAVEDYFNPARIVVGTADGRPSRRLAELYRNIDAPTFITTFAEAELVKFVDNAWHAAKVAFANEIGRLCARLGVSAARMHEMFIADSKLNLSPYYTRPGGPFGGSCLPKDLRALSFMAGEIGIDSPLIASVLASNEAHKRFLFEWCVRGLPAGAHVLMIGLAFKPGSDDLRESPKVALARDLIDAGLRVSIHDPFVNPGRLVGKNLEQTLDRLPRLDRMLVTEEEARSGAYDAVIDTFGWAARLSLQSGNVIDIHRLA